MTLGAFLWLLLLPIPTEHLVQDSPLHEVLRHHIWTEETLVTQKLHSRLEDLRYAVAFVGECPFEVNENNIIAHPPYSLDQGWAKYIQPADVFEPVHQPKLI